MVLQAFPSCALGSCAILADSPQKTCPNLVRRAWKGSSGKIREFPFKIAWFGSCSRTLESQDPWFASASGNPINEVYSKPRQTGHANRHFIRWRPFRFHFWRRWRGGAYNSDVTTKKCSRKMTPDPNEHYWTSEVKKFANMAKSIRNVDEAKGHSHVVADFIDLKFSDNSGMMAKARRSKDSWTKLRFETACNKAVRIMEERCACLTYFLPYTVPLPLPTNLHNITHNLTQGSLIQPGRQTIRWRTQKSSQRPVQYRRMSQLSSHIFWMDLGEAGYLDFRKSLKQKCLAKQIHTTHRNPFLR